MSLQATFMAASLFVGGADHAPASDALSDMEKSFVDVVAAADRAEMELSRAAAHSSKPAVRRLARTLLDEDAANYHDLFRLCLTKTYAIAPQLDERHREALQRLQASAATQDGAMEQTYIDTIRLDQADLSGILERISSDATDGELSRFAAVTLAMVQKHQLMLHELAANTRG